MATARFVSGVASGDPTTNSVVLWGRIEDAPGPVTWTITDVDGAVAATGSVVSDGCGVLRVEADGLRPGTSYRYVFAVDDQRSSVGRTRTLAERPSSVRLGVACCARWPNGEFIGYRALAEAEVDVMVHLGDYIYEDGDGGDRGRHDPPHECVTQHDYDRRYRQYRTDPDLAALHATAPWVATLDDHEVDDNAARFAASGRMAASSGEVDPERRQAGIDAQARWMPQRAHGNGPTPCDRHIAIGDLCDVVLVDTRLGGREQQVGKGSGPAPQPRDSHSPRLLSDEQWDWLDQIVGASTASWILLASQVQVAPLRLGWWPTCSHGRRWRPRLARVINPDQWDGYPAERQRLIDLLDRHDRRDVVVLSGDLHGRFITSTRRIDGPDLMEVTTPSISAPTFAAMLDARLPIPSRWAAKWIRLVNPHIRQLDLEHHGATVVDVDHDVIRISDAVRPHAGNWTLRRDGA